MQQKNVTASIVLHNSNKVNTFQILWTSDHINYKCLLSRIITFKVISYTPHYNRILSNKSSMPEHKPKWQYKKSTTLSNI